MRSQAPAALANPGDVCLCEAPTFLGTIHHIRFHGIRTVPVMLDDEGLDVEALEREIDRLEAAGTPPRFVYTIPTFNNPAGVTMSLGRRRALLDIAARPGVPVIEDDAYRDLRFEGEPIPTLHALDGEGLVIRLGTSRRSSRPAWLAFSLQPPAAGPDRPGGPPARPRRSRGALSGADPPRPGAGRRACLRRRQALRGTGCSPPCSGVVRAGRRSNGSRNAAYSKSATTSRNPILTT